MNLKINNYKAALGIDVAAGRFCPQFAFCLVKRNDAMIDNLQFMPKNEWMNEESSF